jgi:hypothetical protein
VRHGSHYNSSNDDEEWHWGWVYSNYSDLSEEELKACSKKVVYDCPVYKFGYIEDVKHVLAYLSSSDRTRIQREREERREREAKRQAEERKKREEEIKKKEEEIKQKEFGVEEGRKRMKQETTKLDTNNNQTGTLANRIIQWWDKNLATAKKLQEAQTENLNTAQRLSQDTSDLTKKLQETQQALQYIQEQKSKSEKKKQELDQRIQQRKEQINELQKVLEDLKAGRIKFNPSKKEVEDKGGINGGGMYSSIINNFVSQLFIYTPKRDPLDEKLKTLEEEAKYQSNLQAQIQVLESAIAKELASLQEDERQATKVGQDLNQKLVQEAIRKEELQKLEQQTKQTFEQRKTQLTQEIGKLDETLRKIQQKNGQVTELAKDVTQGWSNSKTLAQQLQEAQKSNHALAQQLPTDAKELFNQLQETQKKLAHIQEQQNKSQKRQEELTTSTNQRQQQIEVFNKKLAALKSACNTAKPVKDALVSELKTKDQLTQEIQHLEKALAQEKASLQQELEEAKILQSQLSQQVNQAASKKKELVHLEKQLEEAFQKKRNQLTQELKQIEGEVQQLSNKHGASQGFTNKISQTWEENERQARTLVDTKQKNKDAVDRILPNMLGTQAMLQQQLDEAQRKLQEITQQKQRAQQQKEEVAITIKQREEHIQQLQQQIADLNKQYQSANPPREITLEGSAQQQEKLKQQLRELIDQVTHEQARLQEEQQEATRVQEKLLQEVREEEEKLRKLAAIEKELQKRIQEGKALEEEVNQALYQELARSIEADKKTEALINQLRQEADVLKDRKAPQHLIDELEKLTQQEVTSLQESNQRTRNRSRADLREKVLELQNAQSKREADARRQVATVQRIAEIDLEALNHELTQLKEENERKTAENMKRLEELRKEAEEDRQRAARRVQEDEENKRRRKERNKPWYEKAWDWVKENPVTATIVGVVVVGVIAVATWYVAQLIVESIASTGASGFWSWLFTTSPGLRTLGTPTLGWLSMNLERLNNWSNGRGWITKKERKRQEREAREQEERRLRKEAEDRRIEELKKQKELLLQEQKAREEEEKRRKQQAEEENKKKEEEHRQQRLADRDREERQLRQQEEDRREKETKRQIGEQLRRGQETMGEEDRKKFEEARKKEEVTKEIEEIHESESPTEIGSLLPQSKQANSSVRERMQQELSNLTNKVKSIFKQFAPSKEATAVTDYTKQVRDIIDNLAKNGNSPLLATQAITLIEKMDKLAQDIQLSQQAVELLSKQHVLSIDLKKHLTDRAKDLQIQLDNLNQTKDQLEKKIEEQPQPTSSKVDPKKISEAAKNAVKAILESKNPPDPPPVITKDKRGKLIYQYKARCNEGVNMVYEQLTGNKDLNNKRANEMIEHMSQSPHWKKIDTMEDAHKLAEEGYIVVAGWHSHSAESGHVAVVVPGDMVKDEWWGCPVPLTLDTGAHARQAAGQLSKGFGKGKRQKIEFYVYQGPINK